MNADTVGQAGKLAADEVRPMTAAQKDTARAALLDWHGRVNSYESKVAELVWFWDQAEGCQAAASVLRNMALDVGLSSLADLAVVADDHAAAWHVRAGTFHDRYVTQGCPLESDDELAAQLALVDEARLLPDAA